MKSTTVPEFWQLYRKLPKRIREAARNAYRRFQDDPSHPALFLHRLEGNTDFWSVRVTLGYRAVGLVDRGTITWFWIGKHADFDRAFPRR
ncbi:MAG: type II toxin-antitoxin system RelE family toxin [Planctomycetaceae bacterium]